MILTLIGLFGTGILLSLTPCALPMLGIMAGILTGPEIPITSKRGFQLASAYVVASSVCYAVLGAISGLTGTFIQGVLHTPWIVGPMAGLLVLLALMQLDIVKFNFRSFGFLDKIGISRDSLTGSALLGVLSVITMSPCVTPVLVGILAYIGANGAIGAITGALQLFVLGLGMGVPLLLLALFGGYMIPKTGSWMKYVKYGTSLILVGLAFNLAYGLVPKADPLALTETKREYTSFNAKAVHNVAQFNTILSQSNRPVLVIVHASWCPWCVKMIDEMKDSPALLAKFNKDYDVVSIDLTSKSTDNTALYKELAKSVSGAGLPFQAKYVKGVRVNVHNGYLSPEQLMRF